MNKIKISIKGKGGTGKSTVLVVLAQHLAQLGYEVNVPKNLVGLSVSEAMVNRNTSQQTQITFEEVSKQTKKVDLVPQVKQHIDLLGMIVVDRVTGFKGVIASVCFDLYGCIQAVVNPGLDKDGKLQDSQWFDISRLALTSESPVMDQPDFENGKQAEGKQGPAEKPRYVKN